jgi:hypothetical protein
VYFFTEIIKECAINVVRKQKTYYDNDNDYKTKNNKHKQAKWFNDECRHSKKEFSKARNNFFRRKNDAQSRRNYVEAKSKYNTNINGTFTIENVKLFLLMFADDAALFAQDPATLQTHLFKNNNWNRTQKRLAQPAAYSMHNLFIVINQRDLPIKD